MPAAFKLGCQECVDDIEGEAKAYDAGADGQHIGVIMLADHAGREGVHTHATTYPFDLIGRHHNALAGPAQKNAELILASCDKVGGLGTAFGIGRAFRGHGPNVIDCPALGGHMVVNGTPQLNRGVVAGQHKAVWLGHGSGLFAVVAADAGLDTIQSRAANSKFIAVIGVAGQLGELAR